MFWIIGLIVLVWICTPTVVYYMPPPEVQIVVEERWPPWQPIELEQYERHQREEEEN